MDHTFKDPISGNVINVDWDFITKYYPNYDHADEIAWEDDLECALNNECDDEKLVRIKAEWGETKEEWQKAHDELYMQICQNAIENYKRLYHERTGSPSQILTN